MALTHRTAIADLGAGTYGALSTSTFTASSPVFRVYVPQGQAVPYSVLQNFTENPSEFSAMGSPAKDCTFQLRVVSQSRGEAQASDVLSLAVGILMRGFFGSSEAPSVTVANHRLLLMEYEGSDGFEDVDDAGVETFERIGRFRAHLEQST